MTIEASSKEITSRKSHTWKKYETNNDKQSLKA